MNDAVMEETFIPSTDAEIEQFLKDNEKLIHTVCHKFDWSDVEYDDLHQEAMIGFVKGIRSYSASKRTQLTTYCFACAVNQIRMVLRRENSKGRSANVVSLDEYFTPNGKDQEVNPINNITVSETDGLHMKEASLETTVTMREMARLAIKYARECLDETEYQVLMMWYHSETQDNIAKALNISQATTSKLIHYSHGKLRWYMEQHGYFSIKDFRD